MNLLYLTFSTLLVITNGMRARKPFKSCANDIKTAYRWYQLEFGFPNYLNRQQAESNGNLIPANAIPIDVQPHYYHKNSFRIFVTIPRFQDGIPYTLATVSDKVGANGPMLQPYPDFEAHNSNNGKDCAVITSAFRVAMTECNQMWVIDSGSASSDAHCPPQLLLYDLNTDQLIHRYPFPPSLYTPEASLFITPIADVRDPPPAGSCKDVMVYVADVTYPGLVVYSFMQNKAWRVENRFMYPDPNHGLHSLAGESFVLMDGIFGMATDKQNLYFHPLASATEYAVPLSVLDDSTLFKNSPQNMAETFRPLGTRSSACAMSAMDSKKNIYCVTLNPIELIRWNVNTPYDSTNIKKLPINPVELQFVSGMKVVRNRQGNEELWMMSNRFQKLAAGTQDFNEVNFRILARSLAAFDCFRSNQDLRNQLIFTD